MIEFSKVDKKVLIISGLVLCFIAGLVFERLYQPSDKTIQIYTQALNDYNNKNYSNAYYLFSRVGKYSKLKPSALYRQGLCANALADENSEYLAFHELFRRFPASHLHTEAKYRTAQLLTEKNPQKAKKYFTEIIISNANDEYKTASEFFKSKIEANEYSQGKHSNTISQIEKGFRDYLSKYPDGKYATESAEIWQELNPDTTSADNTLIAKTYYMAQLYKNAYETLKKTNINDSWAIASATLFKQGENEKAKNLVLTGVSKYSDNIEPSDYKRAVDLYINNSNNYSLASSELFANANGKNKDYIWNLKCKYIQSQEKYKCYENFYSAYQNSDYSPNAMIQAITGRMIKNDYAGAKVIADDFILKYPDSKDLPKVMFFKAKIEQKFTSGTNTETVFKNIIDNYPDSYYAYRSFWITNNLKTPVVSINLENRPVVYPYKYPSKKNAMYYLLLVNDYDMIDKYTDDGFIKSWTDYQRGNYMTSLHKAQKAMDELKIKPNKDDLRWRLVYPLNYFQQVMKESALYGNNPALIISLIKEESYFNPDAQSGAGAMGLMQLMPATAYDTGVKNGYLFNTNDLLNPEFNIILGNIYYSGLRQTLNNNDMLAVASYNGGIGSVQRWLNNFEYSDIDEFLEQIPYDETKNYVEKVFKSYWNYTRIYEK